jgi:outer membrane cobalamin receptor
VPATTSRSNLPGPTPALLLTRIALAAVLALPASALAAGAAPHPTEQEGATNADTTLSGLVVDQSGGAIAGATVVLTSSFAAPRETTTDTGGRYRFAEVAAGAYTITVTAPKFTSVSRRVRMTGSRAENPSISLAILPIEGSVTVRGDLLDAVRTQAADEYNRNKAVTTLENETVIANNPVSNYDSLRLLPGVMSAGAKDRFSAPTHLRGAGAWGQVEQVDDYPAINITPVSAEDGGYTASFSSIIPSLALNHLTLATGGLGVSYGQATGGIIRTGIKRGAAQGPRSTVRLEGMGIGEGVLMADTGGVYGKLDVYVAGQTVYGEYGDKFATYARPMQGLKLGSGLAKVGYTLSPNSRAEALFVGGDESHDYYQLSAEPVTARTLRRDFHTDKSNYFFAGRYDIRPSKNVVFGAGVTHNRFHENRIEDAFDGASVDVSRRNRPQEATRAFVNADWRSTLSDSVAYSSSAGIDLTWDRYKDITTTPVEFEFSEQAAFWRGSLSAGRSLTLNTGIRVAAVDNGFRTTHPVLYDAGASYDLPTHTRLLGSYSTGYKLNKAFYLWWGNGQFIGRPGGEGLRPSRTESTELGVEQDIRRNSRPLGLVRVTAYSTDETDLFNFGDTQTGQPFYDDARVRGLELWSEWKFARFRPFGSFTWLKTERTGSTNPAASNIDLRFSPLPNYAASAGTQIDWSRKLTLSVTAHYDDGGVNEQGVNDAITVTRFESFVRANASAAYRWNDKLTLTVRLENLFNQRDLGYSRSIMNPDGTSRRVVGVQRDPGTIVGGGLQIRF